ncbi:hypothetical protein AX16_005201 [Volvariella volvacea WC 439]|nr:hypothetical protein AX16_005201 [Volvariella volvacea WC 439]
MTSDIDDSSQDEYESLPHRREKKKRLQGACDTCRRRKVKCDSAKMPDKRCTNCISLNLGCTHTPRAKRGSQVGYVKILERRLTTMEELLHKMQSGNAPSPTLSKVKAEPGPSDDKPFTELKYPSPLPIPDETEKSPTLDSPTTDDSEDLAHAALAAHLSRISLHVTEDRFFGQSSGFMLMKQAMDAKESSLGKGSVPFTDRRREYWECRPWEVNHLKNDYKQFIYPPDDLMSKLVDAYFYHINLFHPLLHRPTFEHSIARGLHLHNPQFGATVLVVCALGSRYIDDPRVLLDGGNEEHTAGWRYFSQVPIVPSSFLDRTTLYDVQYYFLATVFLLGSSVPHAAWNILGFGLRCIQERGTHRRKPETHMHTMEEELWKRAFWCLITMDRFISSFLGRHMAVQDEDFDVDFPIDCDDEYWDTWKQPEGKPSYVTAFNRHLKLCEVLAFATRTLYATKKSKKLSGMIGEQWEQHIVRELDSALNRWLDSLPEHLKWDPHRTNSIFYRQSASLYASFCFVRIQVHRPFIQKTHSLSQTSFMMCTNAAKQCIHLLDTVKLRAVMPAPHSVMAAFTSALILVLNFWANRRPTKVDTSKEMQDVYRVLSMLHADEKRWFVAGRCYDMLRQLIAVTDNAQLPFDQTTDSTSSSHSSPASDGSSSHGYQDFSLKQNNPMTSPYTQELSPISQGGTNPSCIWPPFLQPSDWSLNDLFFASLQFPESVSTMQHPSPSLFSSAPFGASSDEVFSQSQPLSQPATQSPVWPNVPGPVNFDEWNSASPDRRTPDSSLSYVTSRNIDNIFGPPSECIDIAAFISAAHAIAGKPFQPQPTIREDAAKDFDVADMQATLTETWDNPLLSAWITKDHDNTLSTLQSMSQTNKSRRKIRLPDPHTLAPEVATLQSNLDNTKLSSWKLDMSVVPFIRTPKLSDHNVLTQPRTSTSGPIVDSPQAEIVISIYNRVPYSPGSVSRASQHAFLSCQSLKDVLDIRRVNQRGSLAVSSSLKDMFMETGNLARTMQGDKIQDLGFNTEGCYDNRKDKILVIILEDQPTILARTPR